ncbi:hypothetical protein PAMA_000466 [Pampus argenteus]
MHSCACGAVRTQVSAIFVCHVVTRPCELKCASCTGRRAARAASSHGLGRIQETTDSRQNSSMTVNAAREGLSLLEELAGTKDSRRQGGDRD